MKLLLCYSVSVPLGLRLVSNFYSLKVSLNYIRHLCNTQWYISCMCCIFQPAFGAGHPKRWSKKSFSALICKKAKKSKKFAANFGKKHVFLSLHPNAGRLFYSPKN